jgi:cytochrome c oxidase subunit 4
MALGSVRDVFRKSDAFLLGVCVVLAGGFLFLAAKNAADAGNFFTIDSLFFTTVCLLLAATFIAVPALTLRERGINPFAVPDGVPAARATEEVHFEGSTRLFLNVLGALLVLTIVEVVLAYIEVPLTLMLIILIGLSLIKAALIMAYFMHLRFERMSLVLTLVPALVVCICLLFIVFPDSFRTREHRATPTRAEQGEPGAEASH